MDTARSIYRVPLLEAALLIGIAFQVSSGLTLFVRGCKHRRGFIAWLQAISGAYLALFLLFHVGAVLFGRRALNLDTNFYFTAAGFHVAPFQFFFTPYYFLGVMALFVQLACAAHQRFRHLPRVARVLIVTAPPVFGTVASLLIVLSLAGALYPVEVPAQYKATYAPTQR